MSNINKNRLFIGMGILLVVLGGVFILTKNRSEAPTVEYSTSIVGSWKSVEYSGLLREFKEGGILSDKFGQEEVANGSWELFDKASAPNMPWIPFSEDLVYLRINLTGEERGNIYFEITSLTEEELELLYLDSNGETMKFTREK